MLSKKTTEVAKNVVTPTIAVLKKETPSVNYIAQLEASQKHAKELESKVEASEKHAHELEAEVQGSEKHSHELESEIELTVKQTH